MTYKKNFVVVIKHNGRILRDTDNIVKLPFGSEYSVLLKNLDNRKAVISMTIDGDDVLDGNRIIVDANTTTEIKGFMRGSNFKNRFRFIEKTDRISRYRGDRIDDGIVRIEYQFEEEEIVPLQIYNDPPTFRSGPWGNQFTVGDSLTKGAKYHNWEHTTVNYCCSLNDSGITTKGSEMHQGTVVGHTRRLESKKHVITLQLRGKTSGKKVKKPITVKTKVRCKVCGTQHRSHYKYCGSCGTYLR